MLKILRKKMKGIIIAVAILFAGSILYGVGYQSLRGFKGGQDKGSIAKVNGKEIDRVRFFRSVNNMYEQQGDRVKPHEILIIQTVALNQVIDFTIMLQEARRNVRVSGRELDQVIKQVVEQNKMNDISQLKKSLKRSGADFSSFKQTLKDEIAVSKMIDKVKKEVIIGPDDLREVKARHILIQPKYVFLDDEKRRKAENEKAELEARLKAEEVLSKIKSGQEFKTLAKLYSDDTLTKDKGGDLGYFITGTMVTEFEKTVFSLKPGEISNILKTRYGYHIIKVEDTRLRSVSTVEGKDISEIILEEKQEQAFTKWFGELKQKAKIEINNEMLNAYNLALSGNINEGIALLQQAVANDSYDPYKHLFLAELYFQNGKIELAIFEYKKAAEYGSANPDFLISLGNAYLAAKEADVKPNEGDDFIELAVEQFRKASLIAGDNKALHEELKELFETIGYSKDAYNEKKEITRIEKKEKFEEELRGQATLEPTF